MMLKDIYNWIQTNVPEFGEGNGFSNPGSAKFPFGLQNENRNKRLFRWTDSGIMEEFGAT